MNLAISKSLCLRQSAQQCIKTDFKKAGEVAPKVLTSPALIV